jgi:hypothetical protein
MTTNQILYKQDTIDLQKTGNMRLAVPGLSEAILGGLFYLYDTQVKNASDHPASYYDYLISAPNSRKALPRLTSGFRKLLGSYIFKEKHLPGNWPAYIHFLADLKKLHAKPFLVATDYNLFTTASTAYSLLLFDDRHLPDGSRVIEPLLEDACKAICKFKRGGAYNFWLTRMDKRSFFRSAPSNIPVFLLDLRYWIYKNTRLLNLKNFHEADMLMEWILSCYDKQLNQSGSGVIFNIPDDADNTSMAVAFQILFNKWHGKPCCSTDIKPLEYLAMYRDKHRTKSDRYSKWSGNETGAFLTWLKDENLPAFSSPEQGIIPLAVNNVDIVINSNVLFALSLAGMESVPGYGDAVKLISKIIGEYTWPDASLYYPQKFIFPYAISRAWRDASVRDPLLDIAMAQLMVQILDEMADTGDQFSRISNKGEQNNFQQSTALGLITLLNLGRDMSDNCGLSAKYDHVVKTSVNQLLTNIKTDPVRQKNMTKLFPGSRVNYWESGVLYSSSVQELSHWRSHAQATATVVEALAKYVLAYDQSGDEFLSRRLSVNCLDQKWSLSVLPGQ